MLAEQIDKLTFWLMRFEINLVLEKDLLELRNSQKIGFKVWHKIINRHNGLKLKTALSENDSEFSVGL